MSLFDDAEGPSAWVMPAAWRGQRFWVINAQHSVGRRIHQVLFPGLDLKTMTTPAPLDGPIRLSGLVIGMTTSPRRRRCTPLPARAGARRR